MYIDLNWEVKTNAEFQYKLKALTDDIKRLEKETDGDPHGNDKVASRIIDIYRLCKYNAGLLVPYFFPQYPYDKPLSCSARPYSFAMFHMQIGGSLSIRAGRQIGKALEENEPVLTPEGYKPIKTLNVGDVVFDGKGNPTLVTGVFPQGEREIFRITFSDGAYSNCDEEHLWVCAKAGRKFTVKTLKEIRARKGGDRPSSDQGMRIPLTSPVDFPEKVHYIKPYILGLLLGDGALTIGHNVGFTTADPELADSFKEQAGVNLVESAFYGYRLNKDSYQYGINPFRDELIRLNLLHTAEKKFIPKEYLYDSVENRLALLRGLMDTDGSIYGKCQIEFYSVSKQLAEDVQFLVHSLGGTARIKTKQGYYKKEGARINCKICYRVKIKIQDINPFKLKRKADRFYNIKYDKTRVIKNIISLGFSKAVCISVASAEKTFLTRDCIVTHNSTSFAARQLIYAHIMGKRRSMYIVPHQFFLETYANRLREMERAFRFYQVHKDYRQNLKYKEYPNESVTMLVKCLTDTQEARSKTTDEALFDESVHPNTIVYTIEGGKIKQRKISDILAGEKVLAYDQEGSIKEAYVRYNKNKGRKHTWKLKFSNGSELICTGNTRFWTNRGWMFLSEFLSWGEADRGDNLREAKTLLSIREAATPGDTSWRREHAMGIEITRTNSLHARASAGSLLLPKSAGTEKLCKNPTADCKKQRVGGQELRVLNSADSSIQFYTCPGIPPGFYESSEAGENSYTGMAESTDVGGDCVVVSGRWNTDAGGRSTHQHTRVSTRTGGAVSEHADAKRSDGQSAASEKRPDDLLHNSNRGGSDTQIYRESETLCSRIYDVQSEFTGSGISDMPFLSDFFFEEAGTDSGYTCVRGLYVPKESGGAKKQEIHRKVGREFSFVGEKNKTENGTESGIKSGFNTQEKTSRGNKETRSYLCGKVESYKSAVEEGQRGESKSAKSSAHDRSELRITDAGESQNSSARPDEESQEIRDAETQTRKHLIPVTLESIEYAGKEEVWDIDVEEHHTFFANGIAIHNCQLLDPDFLPDIEQCQKASRMPSTIYAGTSTTTDTVLETKFLESSQAAWLIRAPGYHSNSAGHGWLNCSDKDDVLKAIRPMGLTNPATSQVIDVTDGRFVHQVQSNFEQGYLGFHIPQIIIPDYANIPQKWMEIWNAFQSYDIKKFLQEILGIPTEEGMREITTQDLKSICVLPETPETLKHIASSNSGRYKYTVSGCDWGGSDYNPASKTKVSYTVNVILGICWDGSIEIIHIRQYSGMDYRSIANQICDDYKTYNCVGIASDFGVGAAYNMLLRENPAIRPERHFIFGYVGPQAALIKAPSSGPGWFNQYSLNRTEAITSLYQAIKSKRFRCYSWDLAQERLMELLNLYRVPTETIGGNSGFRYQRHGSKADDTLHAINFAFCLARIIMNEPIIEDPALSQMFRETFNPSQQMQFFNPHGGFDLGGAISG